MERIVQPDYKRLRFSLDPSTGYYKMTAGEPGFTKVPSELKIEETQRPEIIRARYIIRGRIKDGKYLFFTGIKETGSPGWFYGDYFEKRNGIKRNSFILFHLSGDNTALEIFFFNHFKLYPKLRGYFVKEFMTRVKKEPGRIPDPDPNLFNLNDRTNAVEETQRYAE
jgi:hypothetical protein